MHFAFLCKDKAGALQVRLDTRPEHLAYLNALNADGKLAFAGPFLGDDGKPTGSLVVVKAETIEAAREIAANDPYAKAGLFAEVEVKAWNWVFNNPEA
jgi:uncharacterized protein YciI